MDGLDAKISQVRNMQEYIGGCQAFFEKVLTDLLLRQPDDPAEFMIETINAMPAEEKAKWNKKVVNQAVTASQNANKGVPPATSAEAVAEMKTSSGAVPAVAFTKDTVQVVLRLDLNEDDGVKNACLVVLKRLRDQGRKLKGCVSFNVFEEAEQSSLLLLQTWSNQAALDNYYEQDFFRESTPEFAGLLAGPPEYRVFSPC